MRVGLVAGQVGEGGEPTVGVKGRLEARPTGRRVPIVEPREVHEVSPREGSPCLLEGGGPSVIACSRWAMVFLSSRGVPANLIPRACSLSVVIRLVGVDGRPC